MEIIILIAVVIAAIFAVAELCKTEEFYRQSFWWDTFDGLSCSTAIIYKLKWFPIYYEEWKCNYRSPSDHPDYKDFKIKVEKLKIQLENKQL